MKVFKNNNATILINLESKKNNWLRELLKELCLLRDFLCSCCCLSDPAHPWDSREMSEGKSTSPRAPTRHCSFLPFSHPILEQSSFFYSFFLLLPFSNTFAACSCIDSEWEEKPNDRKAAWRNLPLTYTLTELTFLASSTCPTPQRACISFTC